jgi:hypothetical protein
MLIRASLALQAREREITSAVTQPGFAGVFTAETRYQPTDEHRGVDRPPSALIAVHREARTQRKS